MEARIYSIFNNKHKKEVFKDMCLDTLNDKVQIVKDIILKTAQSFEVESFTLSSLNPINEFEDITYFELWFIASKESDNDIQLHLAIKLEDGTYSLEGLTDYARDKIKTPVLTIEEDIIKENIFSKFKNYLFKG